jgi:hypothetical protein
VTGLGRHLPLIAAADSAQEVLDAESLGARIGLSGIAKRRS